MFVGTGETITLVSKNSSDKNVFRLCLKQLTVTTSRIKTGKLFQIHVAECVKPRATKTVQVLALREVLDQMADGCVEL